MNQQRINFEKIVKQKRTTTYGKSSTLLFSISKLTSGVTRKSWVVGPSPNKFLTH
jgi:hypothetical protein